jgi:D-sedoheptulose 7-phosphate isomerase
MRNKEYIENYLSEMKRVIGEISRDDLDRIIEILFEAWRDGKQVFTCGNGGSASTATHFACDLAKTTIVEGKKRFRVIGLNDNIPLMSAIINDEGFDNLFSEQLLSLFQQGDVLLCISVHGGSGRDKAELWSQNLLKAMKLAKELGGKRIGLSGFDGGPMKEIADACIVVHINSTPHVESFHLALEHLICSCLREKIVGYEESSLS